MTCNVRLRLMAFFASSSSQRWRDISMMAAVAAGLLALTACDSSPVRAVLNEYEVFTQPPDETDSLDAEVAAKVLPAGSDGHSSSWFGRVSRVLRSAIWGS